MPNNVIFKKDNIFTSKAQTFVNTVNCVGVMGAGIALEFKYRYPEMFDKYASLCKQGLIEVGKLWIYDFSRGKNKILNFPTKIHWKAPSKYEYLEKGLTRFVGTYEEKGITSIAFPLLGAQNGGLDPEKVLDIMFYHLEKCSIPIEIYEYAPYAKDDLIDTFSRIFTYSNLKEIEKITSIKKNNIEKIKRVIESNQLNSLIQLTKIKGLGEDTIKSCYRLAINSKDREVFYPVEIFSDSIVNEPMIEKNTINEMKEAPNKKRIKKEKIKKQFVIGEKVLLTGLDEKTIIKIEAYNDDVTIANLKSYCFNLKINFKNYLKNFVPLTNFKK